MTTQTENKDAVQPQEQQPQKDTKEYNFAQLRKQLESEKNEKQKLEQRIAELEKGMQSNKQKDDEGDNDHYDEPYVDERRLNKRLSKFEQEMERKIQEAANLKAREAIEEERRQNYLRQNADFSNILTPELIQRFAEKYPELAEPLVEMPDGFSKQKLLYQNIKALGLHKPPEQKPSIQETIDKNRKGIWYQPTNIPNAPYAAASDFSETGQKSSYEKMKELQKRMRG